VATTQEHIEGKVRLLNGRYGIDGTYSDCKVLESPYDRWCEKNWLPIQSTDMIIYGWSPFEVLDRRGVRRSIPTPPLFSSFCGSAPPIVVGDKFWTMVHVVEDPCVTPRKYYHLFVETQSIDKITRFTLPFVFRSAAVEYCLSCRLSDPTTVSCYVSFADSDPTQVDIPFSSLDWVSLPESI
jgi:hypothetical protein